MNEAMFKDVCVRAKKGDSFSYQLLSRMQSDCKYFLGNGNRYEGHLWGGSVKNHLSYMRKLYTSFPKDLRPEWLTEEELNYYEKEMKKGKE